jgi:Domain of unknown function (DUF5658)
VLRTRIVGVGLAVAMAMAPTASRAQSGAESPDPPEAEAQALVVRHPFQPAPPIEAPPTRPMVLPPLYAGFAALQVFDGYTTTHGVQAGAEEANPLLDPFAGNEAAIWALKAGVTAVAIVAAEQLWRRHHRAQAIAVMVVSNTVMGVVAAHNATVTSAAR